MAPKKDKDDSELELPSSVDPAIAEQLVEQARTDGVDPVGPGGLLSELTKQFFLVADLGGQVAGFVWAGLSRTEPEDEGEIIGLYVLPTRQREGLGRLLVAHAVNRLWRSHAISSLLIGCVKENPSCGFYRHLGGIESFRRPGTVDNFQTEEIFFRWIDLAPLT